MAALLETVLAQDTAVATLKRALGSDRVHHAYLFDGPDGVGKELCAFGLAQALVCERRAPDGDAACGTCSACTRAVPREDERKTRHPDVVALERGLYDPAQIGRRSPETQDISIDQVRTLVLARSAFAAHEGRAKVFVVRRAEEMSVSAANALLKTLEEPGKATYFVLLTSRPNELLDTIRSRTQRVRFAPLPERVIGELLAGRGVEAKRAAEIAQLSAGSFEAALLAADADKSKVREDFVARAISAIDAPDPGPALALAEEAKKAKDGLDALLGALATRLAARARERIDDARASESDAARHSLALAAARQLEGNASAQLVVESMLLRMRSI